ncbi:hypothetical protein N0V82_004276 [Gnomoniopsis sp. IMI 355080]|nr:hypothetical protein N0V82_004276 [Gnomoniopsis sp. IMI 355080]
MSSLSSATGLNRTRSLRQPTAGLGGVPKKDDARIDDTKKTLENRRKAAIASASSSGIDTQQNTSPSKLPKPGASLTAAARTRVGPAGIGSRTATTSATGTRSRPKSEIFGPSRTNPEPARQQPTESAQDGAEASKTTRRIPTAGSRLTRPKSMIAPSQSLPPFPARPSSSNPTNPASPSISKPQAPRTTAHARAKSTVTSLGSITSLRPPRPPSVGSTGSASTKATTMTAASKRPLGRANTVNTRTTQQRQVSASSVPDTSVLNTASATTATRPSKQKVTDAPRLKPAFNTLQQHYSPARNLAPKPLTSSYLAPPTPSKLPANVALSTETAKLQTELLQLHLFHRDADAVSASWHASARQRLGRRFEELAQANAETCKEEAASEEARNLAVLKSWASDGGGRSLDDMIQTLDEVLTGLWSLSEPSGRYARVVRRFEKWVAQMMTAVEARRQAGGLGALMESDEVAFISEIDPTWKEEVSSLARKLDGWRRHLTQSEDSLSLQAGGKPQKSSLAVILASCLDQVHGMLAELDTMEEIEQLTFKHEAAWIKRMNREDAVDDTPVAGAIWRAF